MQTIDRYVTEAVLIGMEIDATLESVKLSPLQEAMFDNRSDSQMLKDKLAKLKPRMAKLKERLLASDRVLSAANRLKNKEASRMHKSKAMKAAHAFSRELRPLQKELEAIGAQLNKA